MTLRLHKLVSTYELDPIEIGDYRAVFRFEVFRSNDLYFAKTFRYDLYRLQPFETSDDGSAQKSDEELIVREVAIGTRIETFREASEPKLLERSSPSSRSFSDNLSILNSSSPT